MEYVYFNFILKLGYLDNKFLAMVDEKFCFRQGQFLIATFLLFFLASKSRKNVILLTNTTLTVLRHCGRYLQMSRLLRSITTDVLICLKQLFEYYLYAVCKFFTVDLPVSKDRN